MKFKYKYVFDLDNTLVFTDDLNNESYNYALMQQGLSPIKNCKRINRGFLTKEHPNLTDSDKNRIINLKQDYFIKRVEKTIPNIPLFDLLESQGINNCLLWTSANELRVLAILEHYKIKDSFKQVIFSNKSRLSNDIKEICESLKCESNELVFYEDNPQTIKKLIELNLNVVIFEIN